MKSKVLKKIVIAALLTSVAVVIDVIFKQVIPAGIKDIFGFPFYAIPIIIGSMLLGPLYGTIMAFIADFMGVLISGQVYLIWFIFSALVWGFIPGLLIKIKTKYVFTAFVIFITHVLATLFNTYALSVYGWFRLNDLFLLRLTMIPINTVVMTFIVYQTNKRLAPVYENIFINLK